MDETLMLICLLSDFSFRASACDNKQWKEVRFINLSANSIAKAFAAKFLEEDKQNGSR